MKKDQQLLRIGGSGSKVDLLEPLGNVLKTGRAQPWPGQNNAQRIDIASVWHAPQQRGFDKGGATPHERVINRFSGLCQAFDKKARQLRFEAGAVGNLLKRACLALFGGPELVDIGWHLADGAVGVPADGGQCAGSLVELAKRGQLLGQRRAANCFAARVVIQRQLGSFRAGQGFSVAR